MPTDHVYTEADYNDSACPVRDPYPYSKYLSEKTATDYVSELPPNEAFSLVIINPGAVYGPLLATHHVNSSPQIVRDLMVRSFLTLKSQMTLLYRDLFFNV